jgi:hypothetical protein
MGTYKYIFTVYLFIYLTMLYHQNWLRTPRTEVQLGKSSFLQSDYYRQCFEHNYFSLSLSVTLVWRHCIGRIYHRAGDTIIGQ